MKTKDPLVSIILPVFNAESYVNYAIESILEQTYDNYELIIINDGSTDQSLKIINSYQDSRIVLINRENKGLAISLNEGLNIAKGTYIARMDADDVCLPTRLEKQIEYFVKNPQTVLLGTGAELIDINGNTIGYHIPYTGNKLLKKLIFHYGCVFKHPSVMFNKNVANDVGNYNELIGKYIEDYFLWSKLAKKGKINNIPEILIKYRITPGSIMNFDKDEQFHKFELKIINNGDFNKDDKQEMMKLISSSLSQSKPSFSYSNRINSIKYNKFNRITSILINILGKKNTALLLSKIKNLLKHYESYL
ncbi:MAG: glycosyltransferase [Proteiniphilum sp.]|uniref:glycosyltransferase n=1 Tax=Proteiniphilum sp. TaxID=1926877 RepID=UPI002ABA9BD7|nr:glycosyltransferase [Proteiniphilum sp.]MDY9918633.1 glycosyltransferase [Proteiniphilum sp.]